jgi:hypothetical protein
MSATHASAKSGTSPPSELTVERNCITAISGRKQTQTQRCRENLGKKGAKAARTFTSRPARGAEEAPNGSHLARPSALRLIHGPPLHLHPLHYPLSPHSPSINLLCSNLQLSPKLSPHQATNSLITQLCILVFSHVFSSIFDSAMASSVMNVCSTSVASVAAVSVASGASGLKQAPTSVRFGNGKTCS